jgi:hypothetical protein
MRNAATAYASSASTDVVAYEDLPDHHLLAEPHRHHQRRVVPWFGQRAAPRASHGYAEWDFSGVPDPVMFRWFLDAADY